MSSKLSNAVITIFRHLGYERSNGCMFCETCVNKATEVAEMDKSQGSSTIMVNFDPKSTQQICSRQHSKLDLVVFSEKTRFEISYELSAGQTIHMKCQALFSLKNEKKKFKVLSAVSVVVISALKIKRN